MVFTDREILAAIQNKQIIVDPEPDYSVALSSTSLDLTPVATLSTTIGSSTIRGRSFRQREALMPPLRSASR